MKKLVVSPNAYYQQQYINNGYKITVLESWRNTYIAWDKGEVAKTFLTLEEAEEFTNNLPVIAS